MKTISILGCGWLGFPLAQQLLKNGFEVKGSVTSRSKLTKLRNAGIKASRILVEEDKLLVKDTDFFQTDLLIIAIPPRRISYIETIFPNQIKRITEQIETYKIPRVLFVSSTSVYNERNGVVQEDDALLPEKDSGKALLLSEYLLNNNKNFETTILRFGGLFGADRNPARFLQRSKRLLNGSVPVNLIHLKDCIRIIERIIGEKAWGYTFNACCPEHPTRKEFYEKASAVSGLPLPTFDSKKNAFKIVDSSFLIQILKYRFSFASPIDYLQTL